jgi:hypothetical protein
MVVVNLEVGLVVGERRTGKKAIVAEVGLADKLVEGGKPLGG